MNIDVNSSNDSLNLINETPTRQRFSYDDATVEKLLNDVEHLKREVESSKKDFLTILGIFVSLITFASIQIQILSAAKDPSLLIALSCLMLGGLLLFAMTLVNFVEDNNRWSQIRSPLLLLPLLFFIAGCGLFLCS